MSDDVVKYVERFRYLRFILQKNGFFEEYMNHKIKCGCMKGRQTSSILCDKNIQFMLKGQVYIV